MHKILKGNIACDCGDFHNKTPREIRKTEQCFRRRFNMILHCSTFGITECPKGQTTTMSTLTNNNIVIMYRSMPT